MYSTFDLSCCNNHLLYQLSIIQQFKSIYFIVMKQIKMISITFVATIVLFYSPLMAQNTTFKLSDYKNPNYLYQTLDLQFGLNSGMFVNRTSNATNSNAASLNSQMVARYSKFVNSPKSQGEQHIALNGGIGSTTSTNKPENSNSFEKERNIAFSHLEGISFDVAQRFYNEKQNYFEASGSLATSNQSNSQENKTYTSGNWTRQSESSGKYFSNAITGSFLVGKGRIEQVQDARLAMYLLDDLYKLNRSKRTITDDDVLELAKLITLLKHRRFFDNRLQKIAEIEAIDSFLQNKNIALSTDAAYFTSLNDNWDFANNPVRYSGNRIFTGIEGNWGFNYKNNFAKYQPEDNYIVETTIRENSTGIFLVTGLTCENPKTIKWQNSASFKAGIGIRQKYETEKERNDITNDTESSAYADAIPSVMLSADYGFGYYPNSRTWLTLNWWLLCGWDKEMNGRTLAEKADLQNSFYTYTGPQFRAYFYLSEKLRLNLTFNGELRINHDKYTYNVPDGNDTKQTTIWWNQQINAALSYSLF